MASTSREAMGRTGNLFPVAQKAFQPGSQRRGYLFSPVKDLQHSRTESHQDHPSSPTTPERPSFGVIAQKRNFMPSLRKPSMSLFNPQPARPTAIHSMATSGLHDPFTDGQQHDSSILSQESSFETPALKPLPAKTASPTKSCLRSPQKPKTPGRVVEFTSSTLSPLAQVQARAERTGLASWGQNFKVPGVAAAEENKENVDSPAPPPSLLAPPKMAAYLHKPQDRPPPLSQSAWSRAHWLRLDELLRERRRGGPLNFQLRHPIASAQKRKSGALLGKQVVAQGETLALEQWHLDVVDVFREEVASWDESAIAKRLFALLVGEDRRSQGLVPRRT